MSSATHISYLMQPFNPYKRLYDSELHAHSDEETQQQAQEDTEDGRADWRLQRSRRNTEIPTDQHVQRLYGLCRNTRQIPRDISRHGRDYHKLNGDRVIPDYIGLVVTYRETIKSADLRSLPCIFFIHGGCRYGGTPYSGRYLDRAEQWARYFNAIVVSVDYRLSPNESDGSATDEEPTNDCFDALAWVYIHLGADNDEILKYGDRKKLIVFGSSAGGGLAASTMIKWYQEKHEGATRTTGDILGLMMEAPQLDDRCDTASHREFTDGNMFTSGDAIEGWKASLGSRRGLEDVNAFEAPARARREDLRRLPPTYIEVGTVEPFRDEVKAFSNALLDAGVQVEMRLWQGGFHGFFAAVPGALVSRFCVLSKLRWINRRLGANVRSIEDEYEKTRAEYEAKAEATKGLADWAN
ncbi:Alpha/Beta hydrolase protein [Poronia punctata]|nr:Alpha/Beta hydrolase protein [Poronia punctata]